MAADNPEPGSEALEDLASLKPFRLVKYFSFTSLAVVLASALVLSWAISNNAKKVLLERSEAYMFLFAENLNNQVFQQFVVPTALRYGEIALSNHQQFSMLDTVVQGITQGFKVDSVTIFDSTENIISYSTIDELVGKKDVGGIEYREALQGRKNSRLISRGSLLNLLPGSPPITCKLMTYIPFRKPPGKKDDHIIGITEIVQDLSDDLRAIIHLQGTVITTSIAIMAILFAVLRLIVTHADKIIEARAMERRRLEEKLHQSERLASLGKMVAAVSHEIKNPLGIVHSTAEILGKRVREFSPENEHLAAIIVAETARLDGIVMEFLDFARPQIPNRVPTPVNDILTRVSDFMKPELAKHHIELQKELATNLPPLEIDPHLLYRCFLNILVNAVQAMPNGGRISIMTTANRYEGIDIEIKDNGVGMSAEKQELVFQPFYTDKDQGTGLGLAIAKNIVESHKGDIGVASAEGKGTTFTISLKKQYPE